METIRSLLRALFTLPPLVALFVGTLTTARLRTLRLPGGVFGGADGNLAAFGEADEAGGDHAIVRLQTALHHGLGLVLLLHGDRPHRHRVVVLDDVDEGAIRSALHGAGRDHRHLLEG